MAKASIKAGSTSWISEIFIQDSSSTTGAGKTGLRPDTASLTAYYKRNSGTAAVVISLGTITTLGTFVSGGFKEVDATNMPGLYEFDPPDASIADGATAVVYVLKGAANMAPVALEAELVHVNNQDSVRYGLTALPNAAAEAAGGLFTRGSGAGQINQAANGLVDVSVVRMNNVALSTANAQIGVNVIQIGSSTVSLDAQNLLKVDTEDWKGSVVNALIAGRVDASVGAYQSGLSPLQPTVAGRTLNVSDIGTAAPDWANIGSPTSVVNLTNTTIAAVSGAVGSVTGSVGGNVTGSVGSVVGSVGGNVTGSVGSVAGNVTGSIGSLAAQAKLDVQVQVQNTLGSTTWTQPGQESPASIQTLVGMSAYIYKGMTNRVTQSSATFQLFNSDNVTVDQKGTTADDGTTYSRTKLVSGP